MQIPRNILRLATAASLVVAVAACGEDELASEQASLTPTLTPFTFQPNPGGLKAYKYLPATLPAGAVPVVVVLHGCTQNASQFAQSNEWQRVADALGFILVYPEQTSSNNTVGCFNWAGEYGDPANMIRGQGENASIAAMVNKLQADHPGKVDAARRFVVGFSAGGFMATVMLATWPDLFAAGAVMEGGPYHCADDVNPAFNCMSNGKINNGGSVVDGTPQQWADLVKKHAGFGSYWSSPVQVPRLMVWHGGADSTVSPLNQKSLLKQWTALHGLPLTPSSTGSLKGFSLEQWQKNGEVLVQSVSVPKLQHAVAIEPGTGTDQGGSLGSFTQNVGVFAPYHSMQFLLGATTPGPGPGPGPGPDTVPPTVNITAPASGAVVSGTVTVSVEASDDKNLARVELRVDGNLAGTRTAPPFSFSWDTTASLAAAVPHGLNGSSIRMVRLSAVAVDAAGNQASDDDTSVVVKAGGGAGGGGGGGGSDVTPPTVAITTPASKLSSAGTLLKKNPVLISGTASDDSQVVKVELDVSRYAYLACTGTATPVKTLLASGTTAWSHSLDVAGLDNYRCYKIEARAFDGAGHASAVAEIFLNVMNAPAP